VIVVDTHVIAYLILPGRRWPQAEAALAKDGSWIAPSLWPSEFRKVFSLAPRRGSLPFARGLRCAPETEALMEGREFVVCTAAVLELASATGCPASDCEFVALAQDLRVHLVTTDRRVLAAFPPLAVPLDEFVS
jgi:predicted nucleic acid-binding protein